MTSDPDLFAQARARRTDPETSHLAAQKIEKTGTAQSNRERCLESIRRRPGQTAAEVARDVALERHEPSRRLPELREVWLVKCGPKRRCDVTGNPSLTWWPVEYAQ